MKNRLVCDGEYIIVKVLETQGVRGENLGLSTMNPGDTRGTRQYLWARRWVTRQIGAGDIRRISVLGGRSPREDSIVITLGGDEVVIKRSEERNEFDGYRAAVKEFAGRNGITFTEALA